MSDAENSNGNEAPSGPRQPPRNTQSFTDHGRHIQQDAENLVAAVRDATEDVQRYLTTRVQQRPFSTLGVAAGAGYVLGGGLSARLTIVLLGVATRVATALVARELGTRILQSGSASAQRTSA